MNGSWLSRGCRCDNSVIRERVWFHLLTYIPYRGMLYRLLSARQGGALGRFRYSPLSHDQVCAELEAKRIALGAFLELG
jgi:hypothetical protein